jgi:poly(A) polymerase
MSAAEDLAPLDARDAPHFGWIRGTPAATVMAALEAKAPGGARFVGGCVRDSLIGQAPKDFDIATVMTPDEAGAALKAGGLKVVPTGLEHGTLTAIADHVGVEVTTLRADVATDGRRATVVFAKDWRLDARRRDFRLNAVYLTSDGRLYDPVGGVDDARGGRVRFIGDPADRIREDFLRILRFFRFSARFGGAFDAEGLAACARLKEGIGRLSAERVGDEFARILALSDAAAAVDAMAAAGVLGEIWGDPPERAALRRLKENAREAPAMLALAALWPAAGEGLDSRLRLSNADAGRRRAALRAAAALSSATGRREARSAYYRCGAEAFRDGVALAAARRPDPGWAALADLAPPPAFPISGKDVVNAGIAPGPDVAAILQEVEALWIAEDFPGAARVGALLSAAVAGRAGRAGR